MVLRGGRQVASLTGVPGPPMALGCGMSTSSSAARPTACRPRRRCAA
nr:hypothetical protein [Nonomuraea candida]